MYGELAKIVRVRKRWLCVMCERRIEPGEQARATVLFPGNDIWQNVKPMHGRECRGCAEKYRRWPN